jgi:hypothetical protein
MKILENNQGFSIWQIACGLMLVVLGFNSYVLIPMAMVNNNAGVAVFLMSSFVLVSAIGMLLLSQLTINPIAHALISILTFFYSTLLRSNYLSKLKPLVKRNIDDNKDRNMKFGLMFITTSFICLFIT